MSDNMFAQSASRCRPPHERLTLCWRNIYCSSETIIFIIITTHSPLFCPYHRHHYRSRQEVSRNNLFRVHAVYLPSEMCIHGFDKKNWLLVETERHCVCEQDFVYTVINIKYQCSAAILQHMLLTHMILLVNLHIFILYVSITRNIKWGLHALCSTMW